ncbi:MULTISPECIES: single-stranded DNA-binding protein [Arthrobacter]|uniref:Single-stranded DNA-binding protein n=1 Tax=Arthrobacter terricola TaxID=2547396 RepID=A0A4V2ZS17_9MICC|nr:MULTISPECIES: single-stranded DNA-binding protein [Arthrobacter]MBT8163208.1 single-stranded DNA-binding protein [Arthrobacter sp. GN70]TDF91534.1 single-stranded DNA-binding protein [Arthrobacter terricola]
MSNPRNNGTLLGRLANDPKIFPNQDGSAKVMFTVYTDRNFKNGNGEVVSDALPVERFISKTTDFQATPYARIHKGDLVALQTALRANVYEKNGETVYDDIKIVVEELTFLESRLVTQNRLAKRVTTAEQSNQQARAVSPAQAPDVVPAGATASALKDELPFG